jgi:hypothetical protein
MRAFQPSNYKPALAVGQRKMQETSEPKSDAARHSITTNTRARRGTGTCTHGYRHIRRHTHAVMIALLQQPSLAAPANKHTHTHTIKHTHTHTRCLLRPYMHVRALPLTTSHPRHGAELQTVRATNTPVAPPLQHTPSFKRP